MLDKPRCVMCGKRAVGEMPLFSANEGVPHKAYVNARVCEECYEEWEHSDFFDDDEEWNRVQDELKKDVLKDFKRPR